MKTVVSVLALVACASAGLLGPSVLHAHGPALLHGPVIHGPVLHGPVIAAAPVPVVKHIHPEIYAVPPPILAKPIVYAPPPVVKVLHHPAPLIKALPIGPLGYGLHHHDHHHHHDPFFF